MLLSKIKQKQMKIGYNKEKFGYKRKNAIRYLLNNLWENSSIQEKPNSFFLPLNLGTHFPSEARWNNK